MSDLEALVSALEMRAAGLPVRWYVKRSEVLFAECEWSWTKVRTEATRLPVELAEALAHERRKELPLLPTEAGPIVPMFVAPFFGVEEPPPEGARVAPPAPEAERVPTRREMRSVRERTESAKLGCKTRRFNAMQAEQEWQEEHETR